MRVKLTLEKQNEKKVRRLMYSRKTRRKVHCKEIAVLVKRKKNFSIRKKKHIRNLVIRDDNAGIGGPVLKYFDPATTSGYLWAIFVGSV